MVYHRKALELDPKTGHACNSLAWFLATCRRQEFRNSQRAVQLATKAVELAPNNGEIWNTLGVAQFRAGNCTASIASLEKSMALRKGGDSFDWFFLAMSHWQLDEKDTARMWYEKAVVWMQKNAAQNKELLRFQVEAEELLRNSESESREPPAQDPENQAER